MPFITDSVHSRARIREVGNQRLERALTLFVDVLGFEFVGGGDNPMLEVRAVQLRLPHGAKVELLSPITETSYLRAHIEKRGQGFHHLALLDHAVDDRHAVVVGLDDVGAFGAAGLDGVGVDGALAQQVVLDAQGAALALELRKKGIDDGAALLLGIDGEEHAGRAPAGGWI